MKAVERLEAFPGSGRKVPERNDPEIREVIETRAVEVATVFRASRVFPALR